MLREQRGCFAHRNAQLCPPHPTTAKKPWQPSDRGLPRKGLSPPKAAWSRRKKLISFWMLFISFYFIFTLESNYWFFFIKSVPSQLHQSDY